jgi:hypothetical protein
MTKEYKIGRCNKCGINEMMPPSRRTRCKKCLAQNMRNWKNNNPQAKLNQERSVNKYQRNLRREILEYYSGHVPAQCIKCGENRYQCLELDHINDDGAQHGKRLCKAEGYRAYRGVNSYIYRDIKKIIILWAIKLYVQIVIALRQKGCITVR